MALRLEGKGNGREVDGLQCFCSFHCVMMVIGGIKQVCFIGECHI